MKHQNHYCTRCNKTMAFQVEGTIFTCTGCGVKTELNKRPGESRSLIGDPFHQFRVGFG